VKCELCNKNPCQCVDRIQRSTKKMGWKIELEKRMDDLNYRVRELEALLKKLSKPEPKKKPVKKATPKAIETIAEA